MARSQQQNSDRTKRKRRQDAPNRRMKKKVCYFCTERIKYIDYKDVSTLRRYVSDRAKIRSRRVSGNCPRHQREVAVAVKSAREVALLPYLPTR